MDDRLKTIRRRGKKGRKWWGTPFQALRPAEQRKRKRKMKLLSKRAVPILIVSLMLVSLIPVQVNAAIGNLLVYTKDGILTTEGTYGETLIVTGSGVTAGVNVNFYWDAVKPWDGAKGLLNATEAAASGNFEVWFDVPSALNGPHYLWVKDTSNDQTAVSAAFYVRAKIKLSPSSGLMGDKITIKGYGFSKEKKISPIYWDYYTYSPAVLLTSPAVPETNTLGYWEATFKVPDTTYRDDYYVYAEDELHVNAEFKFKVGASITFEYEKGPVGSVVEVKGRGFTLLEKIEAGEITLYDKYPTTPVTIPLYIFDKPVSIESDKEFSLDIVIPQVSKKNVEYTITVKDGSLTGTATGDFNVTALAKIETVPEYGVQGYRVDITGTNFIHMSGKKVMLELYDKDLVKKADIKEFETSSDGSFTGTFTVPAVASGNYKILGVQTDYNIKDDATFRVGMIIVILSKTSGPSGTRVTMTGTGFTPNKTWNATFGDELLLEGGVADDGDLELGATVVPFFFVPTSDPGTYTITVLDISEEIEIEVEFEVTDKTETWTDPTVAPNGYNTTILGKYYAEEAGKKLTFVLYNVTSKGKVDEDWDITGDVKYKTKAVTTDEDGEFKGYWKVYDSDTLSIGEYLLNVTDDEDLFAQYMFDVVSKTIEIEPRKSSFRIGETVGFKVEGSFAQIDSYIEVMEPEGDVYWTTDPFVKDVWIKVGTVMRVPYYEQTAGGNPMMLLEDAHLGTWSWTWYDVGDDKLPYTDDDEEIDTGTFTVEPAAEEVIGKTLETLGLKVEGLTTNFNSLSGTVGTLSTSVTNLAAQVASAAQAATSANQAVTNLSQTVSEIAQVANSAKNAAEAAKASSDDAKKSADEAKTAAGGLAMLVYGAIGASLVAALAAIVSLMQISRRIAG
jgi:uncharacterized protein YoxC